MLGEQQNTPISGAKRGVEAPRRARQQRVCPAPAARPRCLVGIPMDLDSVLTLKPTVLLLEPNRWWCWTFPSGLHVPIAAAKLKGPLSAHTRVAPFPGAVLVLPSSALGVHPPAPLARDLCLRGVSTGEGFGSSQGK